MSRMVKAYGYVFAALVPFLWIQAIAQSGIPSVGNFRVCADPRGNCSRGGFCSFEVASLDCVRTILLPIPFVLEKGVSYIDPACQAEQQSMIAAANAKRLACQAREEASLAICNAMAEQAGLCESLKASEIAKAAPSVAAAKALLKNSRNRNASGLPTPVKDTLSHVFPKNILDSVRQVELGDLSLPLFLTGDLESNGFVVVDSTIFFNRRSIGAEDLLKWKRALAYVEQYQQYGLEGYIQLLVLQPTALAGSGSIRREVGCQKTGATENDRPCKE